LQSGEGNFKDGTGTFLQLDENNQKSYRLIYIDELKKETRWFENGQKIYEINYKDGREDGKWTWWYEDGQIKEERNYKDGHFDGKWVEWDENGQKEDERNFQNGVEIYDTSISYYGNRLVEKERK